MEAVKISPKFQVVIPKSVREAIGLKPGESLQVVIYGNRIELIPIHPIKTLKGMLKDMDTIFEREGDRE
jgi:AbrB family looped-hinge helix DNA binding protein